MSGHHDPVSRTLRWAIQEAQVVRLAYNRLDGITTIHEVAPIDISPGETARTQRTLYLMAWCLVEDQPEMHILDQVVSAVSVGRSFRPSEFLSRWPTERWPLPVEWHVSRLWEPNP